MSKNRMRQSGGPVLPATLSLVAKSKNYKMTSRKWSFLKMPKYRKRRARKAPYKRRHGKRKRIRRAKRALGVSRFKQYSGFPQSRMVRLRYAETVSMDPISTSTATYYNFRANSCFDPNETGTGHQPRGWDQWTQFYNHYVVVGSKCSIRWIVDRPDSTGDDNAAIAVGCRLNDSNIPIFSGVQEAFQHISELGFSYRLMIPNIYKTNSVRTVCKYSPKKFFNVKDMKDNFSRLGANVGTNPVEDALFQMWLCGVGSGPLEGVGVKACVTIDYIVVFGEPKNLSLS